MMCMVRKTKRAVRHLFHPQLSNNHRPRLLHPEGFFVLLAIVIFSFVGLTNINVVSPQLGSILGYSSTITPSTVVEKTNAERAKLGLPPLQINGELSEAALAKASDMFQNQYWAHFSPSGTSPWHFIKNSGYRYSVAGENLARDFLQTDDMVTAWMNSPTHRENIVNPKYQDIGIAVVDGTLLGTETTLVVQMFGATTATARVAQVAPINPEPQIVPEAVAEPPDLSLNTVEEQTLETQPATPQSNTVLAQNQLPYPETTIRLAQLPEQQILAGTLQRFPSASEHSPLFSPLQLSKTFFLAVVLLVLAVLAYDTVIISNRDTVRFVGKNFAHIALFMTVLFLIILFKGGVIV